MSRFDDWLQAIANKQTSQEMQYDCSIACRMMGFEQQDELLDLAERSPPAASDKILKFIISERGKISNATLDNRLNAIKGFLGFHELRDKISWGKIKVAKPKRKKVANDRPPTKDEISSLLDECDSRMKFYVLVLVSSGARRGWTDYASARDLMPVEIQSDTGPFRFGKLVIYRGEPEEYVTFISPEAWEAWLKYRKDRENVGEMIKSDSPLLRDSWERRYYMKGKRNAEKAERIASKTLGNALLELWWRTKIPDPNSQTGFRFVREPHGGEVGDFKAVHGFRKFFETQCTAAGLNPNDIAVLKGTKFSYHKPSVEYLVAQYTKAIPFLTISKAEELKRKNLEMQERFYSIIQRLEDRLNRIELERLREKQPLGGEGEVQRVKNIEA